MARRRKELYSAVHCERGSTWVATPYVEAIYKYRWWFFHINPKLVPPAWRKEYRKLIIVNGKRRGCAEHRGGLIPLARYDLPGSGVRHSLLTFFRRKFGWFCKSYERDYVYITIAGFKFIIIKQVTKSGNVLCEVYDKHTQGPVGSFVFNSDFTEVYVQNILDGYVSTLHIIIGYMADSMVYGLAAAQLNREIVINT